MSPIYSDLCAYNVSLVCRLILSFPVDNHLYFSFMHFHLHRPLGVWSMVQVPADNTRQRF
jgi:hypothetical protein